MSCCNVIIVGGKAGALISYEIIRKAQPCWKIGFLEYFCDESRVMDGIFYKGTIEDFKEPIKSYFVATGDNYLREKITQRMIDKTGLQPINVIHHTAFVSPSAILGYGNWIGPGAIVHSFVKIRNGCIINTRAVVEHDNVLEDYCQISPGAVLCGYVTVGTYSFIAANATVAPHKTIPPRTVVGAGSVVLDDFEWENCLYAGVPAKWKKNYES